MSTENIYSRVRSQPEKARQVGRLSTLLFADKEEATQPEESAEESAWRERLMQGDLTILEPLYDHYAPSLYRVLTAILGVTADAEDALQEVFVRLAQGRVKRVHNLRAYLFTAARNEACTLLRRRGRERAWEASDDDLMQTGASPNTDEMQTLLLRLPVEQREVIAMKVYEEMTFAEIAAIVNASPNTVASRYRYGIERLRGWMQEENTDANQS